MKIKNLAILFIFTLLLANFLSAGEQTTCPVTGQEISKDHYAEQDGERIYVCCENCIDEVTQNFDTYKSKLEESGQSTQAVKAKCNDDCQKECCQANKQKIRKGGKCNGNCTSTKTSNKCCGTAQANAPKKCCGSHK